MGKQPAPVMAPPYGTARARCGVRPRLGPPREMEDAAGPRFSQGVGLVVSIIGVIGYPTGLTFGSTSHRRQCCKLPRFLTPTPIDQTGCLEVLETMHVFQRQIALDTLWILWHFGSTTAKEARRG